MQDTFDNALKFTYEGRTILRGWVTRPIAGSRISALSRFAHPWHGGGHSLGCLFRVRKDPSDWDHVHNDPNMIEFYFEGSFGKPWNGMDSSQTSVPLERSPHQG